jgi:hypothetical protein
VGAGAGKRSVGCYKRNFVNKKSSNTIFGAHNENVTIFVGVCNQNLKVSESVIA